MITIFESLPNEVLLTIFSDLSWSELLISFCSLNKRLNILICCILSRIDNQSNSGIIVIEPGLSFNKCKSIIFPLISVSSCVRRIHLDGTNSNSCDFIYEWLFDNDKRILRFPNLKSLVVTQCLSVKSLMNSLPLLIKHQLDELTLTFDEDMAELLRKSSELSTIDIHTNESMIMFQNLIRQLFSSECRLTSLRLNIACNNSYLDLHQYLKPCNKPSLYSTINQYQSSCLTLRHLYIHLDYTCFLEHLIEYVPLLEKLSVSFQHSLDIWPRSTSDIETVMQRNGNWFNKVPRLQCLILKTLVNNDFEFAYLKWILNNLNHIQKLKICLGSTGFHGANKVIWESVVDANFIRQYCMPDTMVNLTHFEYYIGSKCKLPVNDIEKITRSFKTHPFFINHQWTNVEYFFDPIMSYQHLSSFTVRTPPFLNDIVNYPNVLYWPDIRRVWIDLHPSLYLFLEQFDDLYPNVFCIRVHMEVYSNSNDSTSPISLKMPFEMAKRKLSDIKFRNVTRLDFAPFFSRESGDGDGSIDRNKARAKLLAHLISMPVQLKDLRLNQFEWLLHVIEYASGELRKDALYTVRYSEFGIPSCHRASNESIRIGKNLVPFLSTYMPKLQTLRLWRPDDFPWTSIRLDYKAGYFLGVWASRWYESLRTPESISKHVSIFEQDLCQLVEQMKEFVFLDIHGEIHREKIQPYHSMVQARFPNSQSYVEKSRFRLWI